MRALRLPRWHSEPELADVPTPEPGPGEVVVRIGGAGACHSDLHLMHDFTEGVVPWGPPFTLGHENAGWVEALGPGVSDLEVGEPVAVYGPWGCGRCHSCLTGAENYCERQSELAAAGGGLGFDGGMAPYMLVPRSRWLVPLGDLSPVEAAPLTDAGLTPYHAIVRSLHLLRPGSVSVVIGVGGLGLMAVQILRALSSATTIIAVDTRPTALAAATLIQEADTAMYRSKEAGRDRVTLFDSSMRERVARRGRAARVQALGQLARHRWAAPDCIRGARARASVGSAFSRIERVRAWRNAAPPARVPRPG